MNKERLPQDHPCVVNNARTKIDDPFGREVEYSLDYPEVADPSDGQAKTVLHLLKNKVVTNLFHLHHLHVSG